MVWCTRLTSLPRKHVQPDKYLLPNHLTIKTQMISTSCYYIHLLATKYMYHTPYQSPFRVMAFLQPSLPSSPSQWHRGETSLHTHTNTYTHVYVHVHTWTGSQHTMAVYNSLVSIQVEEAHETIFSAARSHALIWWQEVTYSVKMFKNIRS